MNIPAISIIVPVYKAEKYLSRCVDSLLEQTFTSFEVLLIDDGSPDHSGDMCNDYAAKDSRVLTFHKANGGVSSARQYGMDRAQGEYVIHADPDDWVEPTMLQELYEKAKTEKSDMVICDFYISNEHHDIYVKQKPESLRHQVVLRNLFQYLHGSCWNKLVKRSCCQMYGVSYSQELSFCEDLYFNAMLLKNPIRISYLEKAFYHYDQTINLNSIVSKYDQNSFNYDIMLKNKFCALLSDTSCISFCEKRMGWLVVSRAFLGKTFSSIEFKEKCTPYRHQALAMRPQALIFRIKIYFSCLGYYRLMLHLHNCEMWVRKYVFLQ